MKKFAFLSIIALGLGMVSCDDFTYPNPPAQSNPQEPVFESATLKLTSVAASEVNLIQANDANTPVALAELEAVEGLPEGYTLSFVGQFAGNENFDGAQDFDVAFNGKTITAAADNLDAAFHSALGTIAPYAKQVYIRFKAYAESETAGTPAYRLGGMNTFFGNVTSSVIPFDPGFTVEDSYYLIFSNDGETWNKANAVKFNHSDRSPYDDPSFFVICDFTEQQVSEGMVWEVIPQTTYDSFDLDNGNVYGAVAADSEVRNGKLDDSADRVPGLYDIPGPVKFDINMRDLTFSFMKAIPNFWLAGENVNGNNWSFAPDPTLWTENYVDYAGFANISKEFKISPQAGWGGDFGSDDGLAYEDQNGEYIGTGYATGSKNINVDESGFYYISLNYNTKELKLVKIDSFGITGSFNGWGESVAMKASEDNMVYTLTCELKAGDEWKIRANGQWTVSLGGSFDKLNPFNGSNFVCAQDGTYEITMNLSTLPWTADVVKK